MNLGVGRYIVIASLVVSTVSAGAVLYMYSQYKANQIPLGEVESLTKELSVFMELPVGESPTLATVTDITQLASNPFFSRAKNGDKVLMFTKAAKAVLYRPNTKKIIEVSVFNQQKFDSVTRTTNIPPVKNLSVTILNGTKVNGATTQFKNEFEQAVSDVTVLKTDTARNRDYQDSLIVDISKSHTSRIAQIAKLLDIAISDLPDGETATGSDILIIVGGDKLLRED